jgi:hypothetical protein
MAGVYQEIALLSGISLAKVLQAKGVIDTSFNP